jgi:hypothetical protein
MVQPTAEERNRGIALADEFRIDGALRMTPSAALRLSDGVVHAFYRELAGDGRLLDVHDPSWMLEADYAFVNIRASSPAPDRTGNVVDALKILPTMRVTAIHLAPFFDNTLNNLYAVDSVRAVSDAVLDPRLTEAGLDGDDQIRLLVDAIHILGWRVGFDLEPHTSNFSRIALGNPRCFRWIRLAEDRQGLYGGMSETEMLTPKVQAELADEVGRIVGEGLRKHGLSAVDDVSKGVAAVRACHAELVQTLIKTGWWTLPSHTWSGVGLPRFDHYKVNGDESYPEYEYLNLAGEDQHEHAFGMLSPYKLFDNIPINEEPSLDDPPRPVPEAIALLNGIFPDVQDRYGFDYVRLDYVDHVFDSTLDGTWHLPVSDRLTPQGLADLIAEARRKRPETGAMAERMGVDVEDYGALGFNLLLGTDVLTTMHPEYLNFLFQLQRELDDLGEDNPRVVTRQAPRPDDAEVAPLHPLCSVLAAVDTHDSGHPLFWRVPLSDAVGAEGLHLRHFLARFATCGGRRRPKYEVMGNQDLSSGLYAANNKPVSLEWRDDSAYNERYHALEDRFRELRPFLDSARLGPSYVDHEGGWEAWFLDVADQRLLCVAVLEPDIGAVANWVAEPPELAPSGPIAVDVVLGTELEAAEVHELPLGGGGPRAVPLDGVFLRLDELPRPSCRLYRVTAPRPAGER